MDINLELYKIFYYVVKAGSISGASQELYISSRRQSGYKKTGVQAGRPAIYQGSKGIVLTPEGEVLYKYIEQGYNMIMLAESKFVEAINLDLGNIRIGASDMTLRYFLLPYLEAFHKQYPKVKIKVTNGLLLKRWNC